MKYREIYLGTLSNVLGNVLMLGATIWLTRILSPGNFGEFRVAFNFSVLLIPFFALGGERVISRLIQSEGLSSIYVVRIVAAVTSITVAGLVLLLVGYPLISRVFLAEQVSATVYFVAIAVIPLTIFYNIGNTIWRHASDSTWAQVHLNFTQRALRAPLLLAMSFISPTALSAALAMTTAQAISLIQVRRYLLPVIGWNKPKLRCLRRSFNELLVVGVPVAILAATDRLDVLLVNFVLGSASAGEYDLIYLLALTAMFPAMALSKSTEPLLYDLKRHPERIKQIYGMQRQAALLSLMAIVGIYILSPVLVTALGNAGPNFSSSTLLLSSGLALSAVHGPVMEYLQINGRTRLVLFIAIPLIILFILLKYWAAETGTLAYVAAMSGSFHFALRGLLYLYIYKRDGVTLFNPIVVLMSATGYSALCVYCLVYV